MARYQTRVNSSLIAAIIVLVCLISVVGITYLILSQSNKNDGSIGVNVTTGKVQVDIIDEKETSLIGDVLDFVSPSGAENVYFEPGATYYTQGFCVQNKGNIAINYRIYISDDEDVSREEFEKAFEFYITTDPFLKTDDKLIEFVGDLEAGERSTVYYLVVKMQETAGNDFQDKTYKGIGITVYATQRDANDEKDE